MASFSHGGRGACSRDRLCPLLPSREGGLFPRSPLLPSPLAGGGLFPRSPLLPSPLAGEGPVPVIVFAPFSPCGRRVGDEGALADGTAGAVQGARAWPSTGFRLPFGLGRVTLERPKVTKGLFPHQSDRFAVALGSVTRSDGAPQMGHPCPAAAAPSSLMALLTLCLPLGGLEGDQYRARV